MKQLSFSICVLGFALFAMFFGSGNLIYPLFIGANAFSNYPLAALAFVLSGVFLPFLGIYIMTVFEGNYDLFFQRWGKVGGSLACFLLLTVWIPLGSAPRCISLANASLNLVMGPFASYSFGLVYSLVVAFVLRRRSQIIDLLGYILTPLLLLGLGLIFTTALFTAPKIETLSNEPVFFNALKQGYNTMDLIASFFFCSSVIQLLKESKEPFPTSKVLLASLVGIFLLACVYVGLIYTSAHYGQQLQGVAKEQLLVYLSKFLLGPHFAFVAALCILLACFTTSIALVVVYSDFWVKKKLLSPAASTGLTLALSYGMSNFGLSGIAFITEPILQIAYPILLFFILYTLAFPKKKAGKVDETNP